MSQYPTSDQSADDANGPEDLGHLDQRLRNKFSDFRLPPSAGAWATIEKRLPPVPSPQRRPRRWPLRLPWLLPLVLLVGVGAGWLWRGAAGPWTTAPVAPRREILVSPEAGTQPRRKTRPDAVRQPTRAAAEHPAAQASGAEATSAPATRSALARRPDLRAEGRSGRRLTRVAAPFGHREGVGNDGAARRGQPKTTTPKAAATRVAEVMAGAAKSARNALSEPAAKEADLTSAPEPVPAALRQLVRLEQQAAIDLAVGGPSLATGASREAGIAALQAERAELGRLQHRADSLLLALGASTSALTVAAGPDTARPALTHRWSLLLSATPEQSYLSLRAPAADTLNALRRNHETGRIGLSATLLAEYRLTERLSLGAGLGYNRSGAELRLTNRRTDVGVTFDTTTTQSLSFYTSSNTVYAIRIEYIPQLSPRFNGSGQVIGYDTVYVSRPDTTFTTIVQHDTVRTTNRTINPRLTKKETVTYKDLRPDYHFLTLPLVVRYRFMAQQGRWWADAAAGVQLQFFLGGTQIVTDDGFSYRTETVGPRGGPFRPLNLGLSGSLALNYALHPRLSLSLAPSLRWQALSVFKPETGLSQNPLVTGMQVGVRWKL